MRVILLLLTVGLAGCDGFRAPGVGISEVSVADATSEALSLNIVMDLVNPNSAPVQLYEFRYTVTVEGRYVFEGRRAGGATLSSAGSRTVSLPAVVPFEKVGWQPDALPADASYTVYGHVQYYAPNRLAEIVFDSASRKPRVRFSDRGRPRGSVRPARPPTAVHHNHTHAGCAVMLVGGRDDMALTHQAGRSHAASRNSSDGVSAGCFGHPPGQRPSAHHACPHGHDADGLARCITPESAEAEYLAEIMKPDIQLDSVPEGEGPRLLVRGSGPRSATVSTRTFQRMHGGHGHACDQDRRSRRWTS